MCGKCPQCKFFSDWIDDGGCFVDSRPPLFGFYRPVDDPEAMRMDGGVYPALTLNKWNEVCNWIDKTNGPKKFTMKTSEGLVPHGINVYHHMDEDDIAQQTLQKDGTMLIQKKPDHIIDFESDDNLL